MVERTFSEAILEGFEYLLSNHDDVIAIGQGVWSPWYVGSSMADLDKKFGKDRVIDTPVSEWATTSAAIGASLNGLKPIVIHPRMDFMVLATDSLVNQAAKWNHMLGGQASPALTVRSIINRGGEQGAQHSQSLQSWYAHIPGLRVVMPATVRDARDLLIAATLSPDPVLYIDDRWLYAQREDLPPPTDVDLNRIGNQILRPGSDITLAGCSWATLLNMQAADALAAKGISAEVVDCRILNPFDRRPLVDSVAKTGRLLAVDGSWATCGMSAEILASAVEGVTPGAWKSTPKRIALADSPAPTSVPLEKLYYPDVDEVVEAAMRLV
jgi:acetoin:2,6-dichlorophenolindophenol oxidoreductase subunit beta